jgi:hypothetical protein
MLHPLASIGKVALGIIQKKSALSDSLNHLTFAGSGIGQVDSEPHSWDEVEVADPCAQIPEDPFCSRMDGAGGPSSKDMVFKLVTSGFKPSQHQRVYWHPSPFGGNPESIQRIKIFSISYPTEAMGRVLGKTLVRRKLAATSIL